MKYLYRYTDTGEAVEIERPMQAMPDDLTIEGRPARRVWDASTVPAMSVGGGGGTEYGTAGPPISHSLPKMDLAGATPESMGGHTVYRKGKQLATARGLRIVRNKKDAEAHCAATGYVKED